MKIDCVIGIDPGASGGIVCWMPGKKITAMKMPTDINDLRDYLQWAKSVANPIVFLEKLSVRPDDIAVDGNGANMGKLYRIQRMIANYEQLKTTITFCEVPFAMVHPMVWQNRLKLRVKGEEKAARKKRFRDIAGRLYPEIKPTLWNADATLIMHFGRHVLASDLKWVRQNVPDKMHDRLF